jgi:hypothetical protein
MDGTNDTNRVLDVSKIAYVSKIPDEENSFYENFVVSFLDSKTPPITIKPGDILDKEAERVIATAIDAKDIAFSALDDDEHRFKIISYITVPILLALLATNIITFTKLAASSTCNIVLCSLLACGVIVYASLALVWWQTHKSLERQFENSNSECNRILVEKYNEQLKVKTQVAETKETDTLLRVSFNRISSPR